MKETLYFADNYGDYHSLTIDDNNAETLYKDLKQVTDLIKKEFNIIDVDEGEDDGK